MGQARINRQREQQRRHLQRRHQHHRAQRQRRSLQPVIGDSSPAAQPPPAVAQRHPEQLQVADWFIGDLLRGPLTDHTAERGRQRGAQREQHRDIRLRHGDLLADSLPLRPKESHSLRINRGHGVFGYDARAGARKTARVVHYLLFALLGQVDPRRAQAFRWSGKTPCFVPRPSATSAVLTLPRNSRVDMRAPSARVALNRFGAMNPTQSATRYVRIPSSGGRDRPSAQGGKVVVDVTV
jgi:hypothetical protein